MWPLGFKLSLGNSPPGICEVCGICPLRFNPVFCVVLEILTHHLFKFSVNALFNINFFLFFFKHKFQIENYCCLFKKKNISLEGRKGLIKQKYFFFSFFPFPGEFGSELFWCANGWFLFCFPSVGCDGWSKSSTPPVLYTELHWCASESALFTEYILMRTGNCTEH